MNTTFQNSAQVLSIGVFFSLMIAGLSSTLSTTLFHGLVSQGIPVADATRVAHLPPVSTLFAAFLGYSPMQHLLGPSVLSHLPAKTAAHLLSRSYFPHLISGAFARGLHTAFDFAVIASLVAAWFSWLRGGKHIYREPAPVPARAGAPRVRATAEAAR
jgi:hypothetical protein